MHIAKIVLKNFKSFSKKTEIPLYSGFTAITGPNGSGKSNIIDSILFCLGLSTSTKQLRADKLTDLIHNGKKDTEVCIVFEDNGNRYEIMRKVKITDKGYYSYYYLNGRSVSLSEIHGFLSKFGIYSDAYNIVMQGDVTRIIEMSPFQRRKIIDDIAGISEFDEKKEKALEELERVRENIDKLEAVISEVNDRLSSLEKDKNEALKYKELVAKKGEYEFYLKCHNYISIKNIKEKIERELESLEKYKDSLSSKLPEIIEKITSISKRLDEITNEISKLGDEKSAEIHAQILELTSELESIKNSEKIFLEETERIEEEVLKELSEISKLNDELSEIDKEIEEYALKKIQIDETIQDLEAQIAELKVKLETVDKAYNELKIELVHKKDEAEKLKDEKLNLLRERDRIVEIIRRIEIELEELQQKNTSLEDQIKQIRAEIDKRARERIEYRERVEEVKNEINNLDKELFSIRSELSDLEDELRSSEVELAKVRARLSALQTYSKPVELVLSAKSNRELAGIFGTVAQLGEVDEEFVSAIEAAAGNSLQFIVVETEDDAVEAIKYLKAVQGGRATFIPLRKIRKFNIKLDKSLLREKGVIDYAVNLVRCEKKFEPVFKFILRDTLVVDNIDTARRLMDRNIRIVTLDGDLVEKSGLMSGGSKERRGMLISKELLEKERELSERVTELQKKKENLLYRLNIVENSRKNLKDEIEKINSILNEMDKIIDVSEEKLRYLEERLKEGNAKMEVLQREREEKIKILNLVNSKIKEINSKLANLEERIDEIEKKLSKSEIPKILNELEVLKEEYSQNREVLLSIEKKIEYLELKKSQIEKLVVEKNKHVEELKNRQEEIKLRIEEGKTRKLEIEEKLKKLKGEEEKISKEVKELRKERDKLINELRRAEDEKNKVEFDIERTTEKINVQKEKLDEVARKLSEFEDISVPKILPPVNEVKRVLRELEEELSKFGDVNLKAIQEYEEVKARRDELLEKKLILERERNDIIDRIERYEKKKREIFFEVFNTINRNFVEVIRELEVGEAELYLDSDDPFNSGLHIKVKPKNKPVQKLESMSGGEKSLLALALIFAIQMYKPAPFYALDEVDMFLDGVNVSRVAKMIKKRSRDAQFIVVSLRKPMLENADAIVGITLGRDNSSKVTGIKLKV